MTTLSWIFAATALIGVVGWLSLLGDIRSGDLNIYKLRSCFWLWTVGNAGNAVYAATREAWSLAVLFSIYFVLAIWGVVEWRRYEPTTLGNSHKMMGLLSSKRPNMLIVDDLESDKPLDQEALKKFKETWFDRYVSGV